MSFIFVGLGNFGEEYNDTRHNSGRIVLEGVRQLLRFPQWRENLIVRCFISEGRVGRESVRLVIPQTLMNVSGESVARLVRTGSDLKRLVVIHDDLDIPLGGLKLSFNRSSGGHRGVESIINRLKSKEFVRLRIGIDPQNRTPLSKKTKGQREITKFLLGKLKAVERASLRRLIPRASEVLRMLVTEGLEKTLTFANRKTSRPVRRLIG